MENILFKVRKGLAVLLMVFWCFPWLKYKVGAMGIYEGVSFSGFTMIGQSFVSLLLFVMPIAILVTLFVPGYEKYERIALIACPVLGIIITIFLGFYVPVSIGLFDSNSGLSEKYSWGIGLWLTIFDYLAIWGITIKTTLNVSRESLKQEGVKNVAKNSMGLVKDAMKELSEEIQKKDNKE